MRALVWLSAQWAAFAVASVLLVGVAGGTVRILPWLLAPEVPLAMAGPFARVLLAAAAEAAILVGVPVGVGIASALLVERGECRALMSLGVRPARLVSTLLAPGLLVAAVAVASSSIAPAETPARLAARLIDAGRATCVASETARRVDVPLAGVSWLCFPAGPRVAAPVPGTATPAFFSASSVLPLDDLRELRLLDLRVAGRLGRTALHLRANEAAVRGLPGWGRARGVAGVIRGALVGLAAVLVSLWVAWLSVTRRSGGAPVPTAASAGLASVAMLAVLRVLDDHGAPLLGYAAVPAVGISALAAAFAALHRLALWRVAGGRPW